MPIVYPIFIQLTLFVFKNTLTNVLSLNGYILFFKILKNCNDLQIYDRGEAEIILTIS